VALILGRRQASLQILNPVYILFIFACSAEQTNGAIDPPSAKGKDDWHSVTCRGVVLGGFIGDVYSLAQEASFCCLTVRWRRGGSHAGQWNASVFVTYAMRRRTDPSSIPWRASFQGWWASFLVLRAGENLTSLMVNGLPASGHSHLSSWIKEILSLLSLEGLRS
jgi:hypothetical protein